MAGLAAGAVRAAEPWPSRPITRIHTGPPGSAPDSVAREVVARIGMALGQPIVVENVPGAGGIIAMEKVRRATFRTMLSRLGVPPHVAELCMNHQETQTMRRVYDGHDCSGETADAWGQSGAHLVALRGGGALVIPIGVARAR